MSLPILTDEQRKENLAKAMAARTERAQFKASVKRGEYSFSQALDAPAAQRIHVKTLIECLPNYGERKAERIMTECGVSYKKRVQGLGNQQRVKLIEILG